MHGLKNMAMGFLTAMVLCTPARADEITVSAAASLTNAFHEIKLVFEQTHPDITVNTNYAASNALLRQIQEGAPVQLFASADQQTMDKAHEFIVPGTRKDFAAGALTLIVPAQPDKNAPVISGPNDLTRPEVKRVAVGNPDSVPAGRYAREALGAQWDTLKDKFVFGSNVRQVLEYVGRGEVDAGIVYKSDTFAMPDKVRATAELSGHTPVVYPLALIKPENADAKKFADFVCSPEGTAILKKYGFNSVNSID